MPIAKSRTKLPQHTVATPQEAIPAPPPTCWVRVVSQDALSTRWELYGCPVCMAWAYPDGTIAGGGVLPERLTGLNHASMCRCAFGEARRLNLLPCPLPVFDRLNELAQRDAQPLSYTESRKGWSQRRWCDQPETLTPQASQPVEIGELPF